MVMFPQAACVVALRRPSLHWLKTLLQTAHRLYFATTVCTSHATPATAVTRSCLKCLTRTTNAFFLARNQQMFMKQVLDQSQCWISVASVKSGCVGAFYTCSINLIINRLRQTAGAVGSYHAIRDRDTTTANRQ